MYLKIKGSFFGRKDEQIDYTLFGAIVIIAENVLEIP